jgi:hypothetical protein
MNRQEYDPVPQAADTILDLKKGEVIKIELDDSKPRPLVRYAKRYKLKPGEDDPRTYVFENSFPKSEGRTTYTAVVLSKYDEMKTVAVQQRRDKEGAGGADADVLGVVQKLKTGEVVEAEIKDAGAGRPPVLTHIERYAPPQKGKFLKVTEAEVEGQKAPAVELERDGKTVSALVSGRMQGKRWVPDAKVLAAAKKLKADAEVVYRAREEDGKLYLKEIEPAPKTSEERGAAAAARDTGGDESRRSRRREK